ncbi:hypothetical protein BH11ACT8_BH11ACT8_34590 [soil metagenome]
MRVGDGHPATPPARRTACPADRQIPEGALLTVVDGKLFVANRRGSRFLALGTGRELPGAAEGHATQVNAVLPWGTGFYYLGTGEVDFLAYAEH